MAAKVDAHYNHLQSLQCRYTERFRGLGMDRTETGTLTLRKPGRMRWAYDTPAGKVFVLDGKSAIAYTPGDAEAQRLPAKQLDDLRSPLRLLLGHTELARELDHLALTPLANNIYTLSGVPRGMSSRVRQIALTVTAPGVIQSMRIEEVDGSVTDFTFSAVRENLPTSATDFTFVSPVGVTIVNATSPL